MEFWGILAALGAALSWSLSGLISHKAARAMGGLGFNRLRMSILCAGLLPVVFISGTWNSLGSENLLILVFSGLIGIFLGDTALFTALDRLGPRRTQMLFASHAPFTVLLSVVFLNERLSVYDLLGAAIVIAGTWIAIFYGKPKENLHRFESIRGSLWVGIVIALIAALCQAAGAILAKPVMMAGADPVFASFIRIGTSAFFLILLGFLPISYLKTKCRTNASLWRASALSGFIGLGLGMGLYLTGLRFAPTGLVAVLSSTTPVLTLPLLWLVMRQIPAHQSWIGALCAIIGTSIILLL